MKEITKALRDCCRPAFRIQALAILMAVQSVNADDGSGESPETGGRAVAVTNADGIIGFGEVMDSPVMQTHGQGGRNPSSDILSTHYVRDHITSQSEAFKYLGSEEESFLAWPLPLTSHSKVVEIQTQTVRYNLVRKKMPRYVYDYDYVTRTVYVREGGSGGGASDSGGYYDERRGSAGKLVKRTVRTREVVNVRQVGYKTCKVKCPHPEGKYEEELSVPVTKSIGLAVLPRGWHAANARLAFTMIKAGLPADDPQIQLIIRSFNNILYAYGIPDTTADVAWLLALYANLPEDDPHVKEWKPRLASRLIAGASQTGSHKGMWGPVCINPDFADEIVDFDADYVARHLTPLQEKISMEASERGKKRLQDDFHDKDKIYQDWQKEYLTWAMAGNAAHFPRRSTILPAVTDQQKDLIFSYSLRVPGLVHDAYHFQFTDLESTCMALFALGEAHASGGLPEQTLVPLDHRKKPLCRPIDVAATLEACHSTLRRLRLADGGWNSCYSVSNHSLCRSIPYTSVLPKDLYGGIAPEEHWAYRIMGVAAMDYLARITGGGTAQRIREETQAARTGLVGWLMGGSNALDFGSAPGGTDLRYFLSDILGDRNPDTLFLWQMIGETGLRDSDSLVNFDVLEDHNSHSARAALAAEQEFIAKNAGLVESWVMEAESPSSMKMQGIRTLGERASITYLLAKGIRPPVFAAVRPTGARPTLPALDHLMNLMSEDSPMNWLYVDSADDIARYITAYHLVMEDRGDHAFSAEEKDKLAEYFGQGGTLVLLALPEKGSGGLEKMAADLLAGIGLEFRVAEGDKRGSRCVDYLVDDRLAVVVVDSAPEADPKATYSKRFKVYKALMDEKLPDDYLSDAYSLLPGRTTSGELTMTGVDWSGAEKDENQ